MIFVWFNTIANFLGSIFLAPVAWMPGWLSLLLVSAICGVLTLLVFKHTSNQPAIRHTRRQIQANLLALSLYKDSIRVSLQAQGRILFNAGRLLVLSLVPMLVMLLPTCLLLGQLALWYQARPLQVGEEAVVTVQLSKTAARELKELQFTPGDCVTVTVGPVRVVTKQMVCWNIKAVEPGLHQLVFTASDQQFGKELAVGDTLMPVSLQRPDASFADVLLHPRETPFAADSPVQSIEIAYPDRTSWIAGSDTWLISWFVLTMLFGLAARPLLKVDL
ncbi:hypothetical protein [Planctomicrobium piriforme]|uniref:Uncharacterized protein n=1 Tax=Planctomicrobium piriforme TaxID=1576369 RepID=A0A1I3JXA7_9PLAN|nr:hypothetical protein [Planctomicrobium piriforme]SFI64814.1 hypothetical protein SAMN05421753_11144 [Planctomicrobium piriforme]